MIPGSGMNRCVSIERRGTVRSVASRRAGLERGWIIAGAAAGLAAAEGKAITELVQGTTLIGGSVGYVFLVALAVTSTNGMQHRLGRRGWLLLHRSGMYVLFGIFTRSYLEPALSAQPLGLSAMTGLLGVLALRVAARLRGRSRRRT